MKTKAGKHVDSVKATKLASISLVKAKLKGKVLFEEKIETLTELINNVKFSAL